MRIAIWVVVFLVAGFIMRDTMIRMSVKETPLKTAEYRNGEGFVWEIVADVALLLACVVGYRLTEGKPANWKCLSCQSQEPPISGEKLVDPTTRLESCKKCGGTMWR